MPVFFKKITDDQFDFEAGFVVKESKRMHLIIGILLLIFAVIFFQGFILFGVIAAAGGIASLLRSRKNQIIMEINKAGFFYYGNRLTNWKNFVSVEFLDEPPALSSKSSGLSDKFFLRLKYYKDNRPECFAYTIPLTNTQDKSEEEIIAAIRFYRRNTSAFDA